MDTDRKITDYERLKDAFFHLGVPYRVFDQKGTTFTPEGCKPVVADRIMAVGSSNYLFLENGKYVGMMTVEKIFEKRHRKRRDQ